MDPNATLTNLRDALKTVRAAGPGQDVDADAALLDSADALVEWLDNGGFLPDCWSRRRRTDATPTAPRTFTLSHRPGEWDGTFTFALHALVTDLLTDAPFIATIAFQDDNEVQRTIVGSVTAITEDGELSIEMGPLAAQLPVANVVSLTVGALAAVA